MAIIAEKVAYINKTYQNCIGYWIDEMQIYILWYCIELTFKLDIFHGRLNNLLTI